MRVHNEKCTPEQFKLALELLLENCIITTENNEKIVIQEATPEALANFIKLVKAIR